MLLSPGTLSSLELLLRREVELFCFSVTDTKIKLIFMLAVSILLYLISDQIDSQGFS